VSATGASAFAQEKVRFPSADPDLTKSAATVRVRNNIATTASGTATIGTEPAARADALERAPAFFARYLRP
jgi:hypothetical protein